MTDVQLSQDYFKRLPKAELHLHLEGAITPGTFQKLSRKYETEYASASEEELSRSLFEYEDFSDFLNTYRIVCQHLREAADYLLLLDELRSYFEDQNIHYAEVIYAPGIAWKFQRDAEEILTALLERGRQIESSAGVKIRWILDCVRQFGPDLARQTAELAGKFREKGVVGLGLGGDENSLPIKDFEEIFTWARAHQIFVHVHAGEVGDPQQIWDALLVLGANRIGHGIQAARDSKLIDYLRDHAVGLDVCLTSNVKTGAWAPISDNPFGLLYKRGVPVSLSTDDPGLFQTTLTGELEKAARYFQLNREDIQRLVLQGLHLSFLLQEEKMTLMKRFQNDIQALSPA